jgi:hypothetical protein
MELGQLNNAAIQLMCIFLVESDSSSGLFLFIYNMLYHTFSGLMVTRLGLDALL